MEICPECDGAGSLVLVGANGHQSYREAYTCTLCGGSGSVASTQSLMKSNLGRSDSKFWEVLRATD
ncbi:hypothetical protein K0504_09270 [Neiella marina]|uniref:Uncharacterized protein n=1 Tax=Neiella holothuriorum TaxID=2870530 RepID=A0ABS7EG75_9GAMM|nr:hypothetical protein [Neiella holothuriorum]MBW8191225.1 hypothetical protein [Neiella holothuriorum]